MMDLENADEVGGYYQWHSIERKWLRSSCWFINFFLVDEARESCCLWSDLFVLIFWEKFSFLYIFGELESRRVFLCPLKERNSSIDGRRRYYLPEVDCEALLLSFIRGNWWRTKLRDQNARRADLWNIRNHSQGVIERPKETYCIM
jgi:hypothetical protein